MFLKKLRPKKSFYLNIKAKNCSMQSEDYKRYSFVKFGKGVSFAWSKIFLIGQNGSWLINVGHP